MGNFWVAVFNAPQNSSWSHAVNMVRYWNGSKGVWTHLTKGNKRGINVNYFPVITRVSVGIYFAYYPEWFWKTLFVYAFLGVKGGRRNSHVLFLGSRISSRIRWLSWLKNGRFCISHGFVFIQKRLNWWDMAIYLLSRLMAGPDTRYILFFFHVTPIHQP